MGLSQYMDAEIASRLNGLSKWAVPVLGAALINSKIDALLSENAEALMSLGYMTDDGMIEIDKLYKDVKQVARDKGSVTEHLPMVGDVTFCEEDVDALRRHIGV